MGEIDEIELVERETGVRGHVGKLHMYFRNGSDDDFTKFLKALSTVEGGTISAAEAAGLLGCSRQRIYQIVRDGDVRCWRVYGGTIHRVTIYSELSVLDLLQLAEDRGRPIAELHALKWVKWSQEVRSYYNKQRSSVDAATDQ